MTGCMTTHTVAIVGGGFSGTLLALQLLRQPATPNVVLLERDHPIGRGLAYSTPNLSHRLNVPAARMSSFSDQPDDFLQWLKANHRGGQAGDFVPRWVFGCYVRGRLDQATALAPGRFEATAGEVQAIAMEPTGVLLHLADGRQVRAGRIVLATGNPPPQRLPMADETFIASAYYRANPWAPDAIAGLDPEAAVLLVGTGLTMVDVVIAMLNAGHRGPIQAISRRGLLPHTHVTAPHEAFVPSEAWRTLSSHLLQQLRRDARTATADGLPWQAVVDCVRHSVQEIWRQSTVADRRRFLRHARPWWDTHRHRIAPEISTRIGQARATGQLRIEAGRITTLTAGLAAAEVAYTPRGCSRPVQVTVARVINCTGPASDLTRSDDPFLRSLLSQGLARPDELRLGVDVNQRGEVVGSDGTVTPHLYAVGPITRGFWWEITSVPDIRRQCALLAEYIA